MQTEILVEELAPQAANVIVEHSQDNSNKTLWINGVFMESELKNRNGRVYPLSEMKKAVADMQQRIKENNGVFGELDHPTISGPGSLNISLQNISHAITDIKMEGSKAIGRAKILPTPMGNIARTLIESGVRIGVSSRGTGQLTESGIVNGFQVVTIDLVCTPSAPGAMPESVYESLQQTASGRHIVSLAEQVREDQRAQEFLKKELIKFFESFKTIR